MVTRTRSPSDSDDDDEVEEGQRGVTQPMGGEPYTGGLEHRLAHVKKFGSFAGTCFSFNVKFVVRIMMVCGHHRKFKPAYRLNFQSMLFDEMDL